MLRILSTQTQQWQGLLLTLYEHEFRGQELNVVFSCLSIDYLSSDVVTRKLGLDIRLNSGEGNIMSSDRTVP